MAPPILTERLQSEGRCRDRVATSVLATADFAGDNGTDEIGRGCPTWPTSLVARVMDLLCALRFALPFRDLRDVLLLFINDLHFLPFPQIGEVHLAQWTVLTVLP